jgi:hypothetical protein
MFKDVENLNGRVIRKLWFEYLKKGEKITDQLGYMTMPKGYDGTDYSLLSHHNNLTEARDFCDPTGEHRKSKRQITLTLPKSSYKQNQKGYDPHNVRA